MMYRDEVNFENAPETTLERWNNIEIEPTLPDKLGEFVFLAVADCRKLDRKIFHPLYLLWHTPIYRVSNPQLHAPSLSVSAIKRKDCFVCFAGGVIAGSLSNSISTGRGREWKPLDFRPDVRSKLEALELCRKGYISHAICRFYQQSEIHRFHYLDRRIGNKDFRSWSQFDAFLGEMEDVAADLEKAGL